MVTFTIPIPGSKQSGQEPSFSFSVKEQAVMLAGSRNRDLPLDMCKDLVKELRLKGFGFLVGCAYGVDRSFRQALCYAPYHKHTFVACAFETRTAPIHSFGLDAFVVVPKNSPPKTALHRRTIWMVRRCQMLIVFPIDPKTGKWGKGSTLAFNSAIHNLKPVFVAAKTPPPENPLYIILPGDLFGIVSGFWAVPHPMEKGGTCEDEF